MGKLYHTIIGVSIMVMHFTNKISLLTCKLLHVEK